MSDDDPDGVRTRTGHRSTVYLADGVYERWKETGIPIGQAVSQWLDVMDTLRDAGYPLNQISNDPAEAVGSLLAGGWPV